LLNENKIIKGLSAALYDQHETQTDDVDFILSIIGDNPKKILEVGCGSGRILVPLAKIGHDVTGFDADEAMLERVSAKADGVTNIKWHKADAVHDDWGTGFDVVILAGNILFNIVSDKEYKKAQELFIQKAASALVPGGRVYIGYSPFAPNGRTLTKPGQSCTDDGSICWSWEGTDDDGNFERGAITSGAFDEETCMLTFTRYFEQIHANGNVIKEENECIKHYATLEHLHKWLHDAGFVIELECKDFDKNPITEHSCDVVIVAQKDMPNGY